MKTRKYIVILSLLLAFGGSASLVIADGHWSDDWKITFMGKAKSTGTISFQVTFQAGEDGTMADPVTIDVLVSDKTTDKEIAELTANNFGAVLGEDGFKISQSWGENVIVKAKGDTPDLSLELISSSVQGISVVIDD